MASTLTCIRIPWPRNQSRQIWPLFLPYLGCRSRCVFCAQEIQTGTSPVAGQHDLERLLLQCEAELRRKAQPPHLAFYGGTFTALPERLWRICLDFARRMLSASLVTGLRCSTRPDCLTAERVAELAASCFEVELGVQTFNSVVLNKSGRGYGRRDVLAACQSLREAGISPGIQLMPGLPGSTPETFLEDVRLAIAAGANCLRFYPCLVLEGSALAALWRAGAYAPWSLETTIDTLAKGLLLAKKAAIPVIRMGLAPQTGLSAAILAGPVHEALASRIQGRALLAAASQAARLAAIYVPDWLQGVFWGWQGELGAAWAELGISANNVHYWRQDTLLLHQA